MPIQRFYNLPSCTLQIEGISGEGGDQLSILTSFEFKFLHNGTQIIGSRELLDSLIKIAGKYAQALQSANPTLVDDPLVSLKPQGTCLHNLTVKSRDALNAPQIIEVEINTVQLFDLVETIDRLCLDPQNALTLKPIFEPVVSSHRRVISLLPAFIGVSSLAIATAVLFMIPSPKPDPKPQTQPTNLVLPQIKTP